MPTGKLSTHRAFEPDASAGYRQTRQWAQKRSAGLAALALPSSSDCRAPRNAGRDSRQRDRVIKFRDRLVAILQILSGALRMDDIEQRRVVESAQMNPIV